MRNPIRRSGLFALFAVCTALIAPPASPQLATTIVRGPYLQVPTPTSMIVRWQTGSPTDSRVRYGTDPANLSEEVTLGAPVTDHEVALTGLDPATRYYYAVGTSVLDLSSGADHTFVTSPAPGTRQPVRIWTFGDSGWGPFPSPFGFSVESHTADVRDAYLAFTGERGTDLWLLLGDNAYAEGNDLEYTVNFFQMYPEVLRQVPMVSAFGNHENFFAFSTDEQCDPLPGPECGNYYDMFTFPANGEAGGVPSGRESWFSFDYANIHFVVLNSQDVPRTPGSEMLAWLADDLAANQQEWTIVAFHHPVYSFGSHNSDTDFTNGELAGQPTGTPPTRHDDFTIQEMRAHALPILEAHGVDLVLVAHSHQYERSKLLNGHYSTSDELESRPELILDGGDGSFDGSGPYRKQVAPGDDANSGTVYAVVGTGSESSFKAALHPAMSTTVDAAGSLVIDVDGNRLDGTFVDFEGNVQDEFTILRGLENLAPVAKDDAATTAPLTEVVIAVVANDVDPEDDTLLVESLTAPALGTVADNGDGTVTYTPGPTLAEGTDSFDYTVHDGNGNTASATVTVTVTCPRLVDQSFSDDLEPDAEPGWTVETASNSIPLSETWAVIEEESASSPSHVWFSDSSERTRFKDDRLISPPLDLSTTSRLTFWHRYNTEPDYDGGVLEISVDGGASWTTLDEEIVTGGYDPLTIAVGDEERTAWNGDSGDLMTRVVVELGGYAGENRRVRWRLLADDFTFDPTEGWYVDDIEFTNLLGELADCNLPPIAADDEAGTTVGTPVSIPVLANDFDPDGDPIRVSRVDPPAHGETAVGPAGSVTYTPALGFVGQDSFTYEISDGAAVDEATVTVTVAAADDDGDSDSDSDGDGGGGGQGLPGH